MVRPDEEDKCLAEGLGKSEWSPFHLRCRRVALNSRSKNCCDYVYIVTMSCLNIRVPGAMTTVENFTR